MVAVAAAVAVAVEIKFNLNIGENMKEGLYESYSLRGTELALLLSGKKAKAVYSLGFMDGSESKEDYLYAIEHMTKQGIAFENEGRLIVNEPYNSMAEFIASAVVTVTIRSSRDDHGDLCIYIDNGGKLLVLSLSPRRKNTVLLTYLDKDELFESYLAEDLFIDNIGAFVPAEELSGEDFIPMLKLLRESAYISDVRFILGVDVVYKDRDSRDSFVVAQMPTGIYTAYFKNDRSSVEVYSKESFKDKLSEVLQGALS